MLGLWLPVSVTVLHSTRGRSLTAEAHHRRSSLHWSRLCAARALCTRCTGLGERGGLSLCTFHFLNFEARKGLFRCPCLSPFK